MSDLIRRSDAIKAIEAEECLGYVECQADWLYDRINAIPTIDAVPKEDYEALQDAFNRTYNALIAIEPKREEWADIIGYEGLYQVSNEARVRNQKGEILKQYIKRGRSTCYKAVKLYKDGRYKTRYIHRIMAECFIPNPNNLPMINHIDEDGTNNRLDNLEWCTVKYNSNYGNAKKNMSKGKKRKANCGARMKGADDDL